MVHTRETRAAASEIKFLIDPARAPRILDWARVHLEADPYGSGPFGDAYDTASLYFDTRRFDVFQRRGSYGRAKYRVRRYGAGPVIFLERKLRKPGVLIKRRTRASIEELGRVIDERDPAWAGEWFRRRLRARQLTPVCQVSYHRIARTLAGAEGTARLTLDSGLRVLPAHEARFSPDPGVPFLEHCVILELKYRVSLPGVFRRLVEDFALRTDTASKYRLAMASLGHAAVAAPAPVVADGGVSYA